MGDVLKAIAAIVLVGAAIKYGVSHVVNEAIAQSGEPGSGYQFECKPLEIPETNFHWNANWMVDSGIVVGRDGGTGKPATMNTSPVSPRSDDVNAERRSELSAEVREMHEAIRTSSDPKREMERMRARMRDTKPGR